MKAPVLILSLGTVLMLAGCTHTLPEQTQIDVPYTSQAPAGNWSEPWQNACEETSIYMVSSFYTDDEIKREEAIKKIHEILAVKNEAFSISADESMETISALIDELNLPWTTEIKYDPTVDDLKKELVGNRPVIVPVYAPEISSTYGENGVDYHVLVLIGYDDSEGVFIVNDPGVDNGQGLRFPYDTFMEAIHDLNQKDYDAGQKAVLFTRQKSWLGF